MFAKIFVLWFGCVTVASAVTVPANLLASWRATVEPHKSECMCQSQVDPSILDRFLYHLEFRDQPCFKCSLKCFMSKLEIMDVSGAISPLKLSQMAANVTHEIADQCVSESKDELDHCHKAFAASLCVVTLVAAKFPQGY